MTNAPSCEAVLNVLKKWWPANQFANEYTLHVSVCGSMDYMELVAYDRPHDMYYASRATWKDLQDEGFRAAMYAMQELGDFVKESERRYLEGL